MKSPVAGRLWRLGIAAALSGSICVLAGCTRAPREPIQTAGVTQIDVWHPWGGTQADAFRDIAREFEKRHPHIRVRLLYTPNDLSANQKFFTAVAAGMPPDVIMEDGPQVAQWAEQGALSPLTERLRSNGLGEKDYFTPCWNQNFYEGEVWALTYCADPNFGFGWNKKDFRDAGLDPERPPRTLKELDEMAQRLEKSEGGKLRRIGIIPWGQFGYANSLFTWGWAFGGSFYDPETRTVTADHPRIVQALEWMCSYARTYDVNRIGTLQAGFTSQEQNPFYIGKLSMQCLHISSLKDIELYAPKDFEYGVTFLPAPEFGEQRSSWIGGWCMALPKGARNPDAAWEYIRWMTSTPEGTKIVAQKAGLLPGFRRSAYFDPSVKKPPHYETFLAILRETRHQRPVMPAQAYYMSALGRAVDMAIHGLMTPKEALEEARRDTQKELDRILAGRTPAAERGSGKR